MDLFLSIDNEFSAYSAQHYIPLAVTFLFACVVIVYARKCLNTTQKKNLLLWISVIPFMGTFMVYPMTLADGSFNVKEDLPLHLCRFLALAAPFVIWKENRYWIGVFYFWIMIGTLNANITPDVEFGFPHWSYFCYWMMHSFLVIIPMYYIMVFGIKIDMRDFKNSFVMLNVFVLITLIFNYLLGSNYMYTMEKPPVKSLLDVLGPWPNYLISGQLLAALLFYIAYLPFKLSKKN